MSFVVGQSKGLNLSQVSSASKRSRRSKRKEPRMVSYREYRQIQRQREDAHQGPGAHDTLKPFASDVHNKTDFGTPYKFVPNNNPPPGLYNPEKGVNLTKPKTKFLAAPTKEKKMDFTLNETMQMPDAGQYNSLKPFGAGMNKVDFGRKYEFKPSRNPGPGEYDADKAMNATKPKVRSACIVQHQQYAVYD